MPSPVIRTLRELRTPPAAFALLVLIAGCVFSPKLPSGQLTCGAGGVCPGNQICSAQGRCCDPTDERAQCSRLIGADAGAPETSPSIDVDQPVALPTARRFVEGQAWLVGGQDGCTNAVPPASFERWCAFTRKQELWVVNATRGARGMIKCDGSDPDCLLMTSTLALGYEGIYEYTRPRFHGDMLLYYADPLHAPTRGEPFRGGVHAWMPGWVKPRKLTGPEGLRCYAHSETSVPVAFCSDRDPADGHLIVHAGLVGPEGGLPRLDRLEATFYGTLPPNGTRFFYSFGVGARPGPLMMAPVADIADRTKHVQLSPSVSWFSTSVEGSSLFALEPVGEGSGTLFSVDVSTGNRRGNLATGVQRADIMWDGFGKDVGVVAYENATSTVGDAKLILDIAEPAKAVALGRVGSVLVSPDRRYSYITKTFDLSRGEHDAIVVDNATSKTTCELQTEPRSLTPFHAFTPDSRFALWSDRITGGIFHEGWIAALPSCQKRRFSGNSSLYYPVPGGLLFVDEVGEAPRLLFESLEEGTAERIGPPRLVGYDVDRFAVLEPDARTVVFDVWVDDVLGLYIAELP